VPYVSSIVSNRIRIRDATPALRTELALFAPTEPAPDELTITLGSPDELPTALSKLRDLGVAFAADTHGWAPAAIFEQLRRQGQLAGRFTEVVFGFHDVPRTRTR
jgi:hypothetical protein